MRDGGPVHVVTAAPLVDEVTLLLEHAHQLADRGVARPIGEALHDLARAGLAQPVDEVEDLALALAQVEEGLLHHRAVRAPRLHRRARTGFSELGKTYFF